MFGDPQRERATLTIPQDVGRLYDLFSGGYLGVVRNSEGIRRFARFVGGHGLEKWAQPAAVHNAPAFVPLMTRKEGGHSPVCFNPSQ